MNKRIAEYLNGLSDADVRVQLAKCCGSRNWISKMAAARPFSNDAQVFAAAHDAWRGLTQSGWLEAFAAHPRIGGQAKDQWAKAEQSGTAKASVATRKALADGNLEYERRFGHVFLICATGLSADVMLSELRRRIGNDAAKELEIAAAEQEKITRLRLEKLVAS